MKNNYTIELEKALKEFFEKEKEAVKDMTPEEEMKYIKDNNKEEEIKKIYEEVKEKCSTQE